MCAGYGIDIDGDDSSSTSSSISMSRAPSVERLNISVSVNWISYNHIDWFCVNIHLYIATSNQITTLLTSDLPSKKPIYEYYSVTGNHDRGNLVIVCALKSCCVCKSGD